MEPHATSTTARQYRRSCVNNEGLPIPIHRRYASTASIFYQQASYKRLLIQVKRGTLTKRMHECSLNLCTGGIAPRMQYAPAAMGSLATKQESITCSMCIATRLR